MDWTRRVLAICAGLLAFLALLTRASPAHAQSTLSERLRLQGVYANQSDRVPAGDFSAQVIPEVSLLLFGKRSQLRVTYTLVASADTAVPAEIANRVGLASTFELSKRTTVLLSADASHTSVSNALVTSSPTEAPAGSVPLSAAGQLLTARVGEGISWEASRVVRFSQTLDAAYITSVSAPLPFESYFVNAVASIDRTWKVDAVGIDFRGGYAESQTAPLPSDRLIPLAVTPHWRHDISQSLTSFFVAGASTVFSPDPGTRPLLGPFAQASLSYLLDDATFGLTGSVGTQTNGLTAQLLYADQVTFRVSAPLSREHALVTAGSASYTHGSIIDRRRDIPPQPSFDSFNSDIGVFWSPTEVVELFTRYQFLQQVTESGGAIVTTPALHRNAVIIGIRLSSSSDPIRVPTRFPERVDRSDAAPAQ